MSGTLDFLLGGSDIKSTQVIEYKLERNSSSLGYEVQNIPIAPVVIKRSYFNLQSAKIGNIANSNAFILSGGTPTYHFVPDPAPNEHISSTVQIRCLLNEGDTSSRGYAIGAVEIVEIES